MIVLNLITLLQSGLEDMVTNQTRSPLVRYAIASKGVVCFPIHTIAGFGFMLGIGMRRELKPTLVIGISGLAQCLQVKTRSLKLLSLGQHQSKWSGFSEPRITARPIWNGEATNERLKESGNPLCGLEIKELCEKRKRWREEMLSQ